jgi:hypothetical protein
MPRIGCWPTLTRTSVIVRSSCCLRSTGCALAKRRHCASIRLTGPDALAVSPEARRQPQIYPLVQSVAEGIARYIDAVRPPSPCPQVFLCMHAPRRRLKAGSIYGVTNRGFVALGTEAAHRGGHPLRHACARRLLTEGLSLKPADAGSALMTSGDDGLSGDVKARRPASRRRCSSRAERLVNLISVFCILSWRIFWLTTLNRVDPDAPPDLALTQSEIDLLDKLVADKSEKRSTIKTISHYLIKIARLGCYLARANDGPPGNKVI